MEIEEELQVSAAFFLEEKQNKRRFWSHIVNGERLKLVESRTLFSDQLIEDGAILILQDDTQENLIRSLHFIN